MKNLLASFIILFCLYNCKKTETVINNKNEKDTAKIVEQKFAVDSISVEDSVKINKFLSLKFSSTVLVFPTLSNKVLLDSIYSRVKISLPKYEKEELKEALISKQNIYLKPTENLDDVYGNREQTWNESSNMKVFSKKNDLLTIIYTGDGYSGGAHGYYYEFYKNFNLSKNTTYQLSDIFTKEDAKTWYPILLKNYLRDGEEDMLFEKEIPLNDNFYFDEKSITFAYNQYEIAPYVAGVVYIKIPFSEISQLINPAFKKEMDLK